MLRRHLSYSNVVATLALVFAMGGGAAYAASHYLITSTKQIKPSVLASLKGKSGPSGANGTNGVNGAAGVQGPQGPAGSTGPGGSAGTAGAAGTNGKSVLTGSFPGTLEPGGEPCKKAGGNSLEIEGSGKKAYACNGEQGKEGTFGGQTLPAGKTLRGTWELTGYGEAKFPEPGFGKAGDAVTFALPLAGTPEEHFIKENASTPAGCTGNVLEPGADEGQLCIFASFEENVLGDAISHFPFGFNINMVSDGKGAMYATGTWAVTGN